MNIRGMVFDCDGTLYCGSEPVEHAVGFVNRLVDELGIQVMYYTNRAHRGPDAVAEKLEGMGFPAVPGQVLTGGTVTARQLRGKRVFCIGEPSLKETLQSEGAVLADQDAEVVVVGYTDDLKRSDLVTATQLIHHGHAGLVATNMDAYIVEEGMRVPENGPLVAAVREASGVDPVIYGKPHPAGIQMARRVMDLDLSQMMLVGDNLETDIQCGIAAGIDTVLLLSGVTSRPQVEATPSEARPTWVAEHLGDPVWGEILNIASGNRAAGSKTGMKHAG